MKAFAFLFFFCVLTGCSTTGGIYKENDAENGEFSLQNTLLTVIGTIGAAVAINSNSYRDEDYKNLYVLDLLDDD